MAKVNPTIGLDHVVIAPLISDDENGVVYGDVIELKGAVTATVNPNSSVETDFGDNGAFFVVNNRGITEMTLEMVGVDPAIQAQMLGQKRVNGITRETGMDSSPYFAVGFRVWVGGTDDNGNKIYKLVWYAKGKFSVPESGAETKKDSVNFQHPTMSAQFSSTQFIPAGETEGTICVHCRTDADVSANTVAHWFDAPIVALSADTGAVTVSAALSDGNIILTGAKVGGGSFAFASETAKIGASIVLADSEGASVAGTVVLSGASTAPTITITPAGTVAKVIVTNQLKDTNGVGVTPAVLSLS